MSQYHRCKLLASSAGPRRVAGVISTLASEMAGYLSEANLPPPKGR